jgi:hypothetical protein
MFSGGSRPAPVNTAPSSKASEPKIIFTSEDYKLFKFNWGFKVESYQDSDFYTLIKAASRTYGPTTTMTNVWTSISFGKGKAIVGEQSGNNPEIIIQVSPQFDPTDAVKASSHFPSTDDVYYDSKVANLLLPEIIERARKDEDITAGEQDMLTAFLMGEPKYWNQMTSMVLSLKCQLLISEDENDEPLRINSKATNPFIEAKKNRGVLVKADQAIAGKMTYGEVFLTKDHTLINLRPVVGYNKAKAIKVESVEDGIGTASN